MPTPIQASYNNENTMISVIAPIKYASLGHKLTSTNFPVNIETGRHSCKLTFPVKQIVTHEFGATFALTLKNNAIPGNVADLSGEASYAHGWDANELSKIKETILTTVEQSTDAKIQIILAKLQLEEQKMRRGNILVQKDELRANKLQNLIQTITKTTTPQHAITAITTALPEHQKPRNRLASKANALAVTICHRGIFHTTTTKTLLLELKSLFEEQTPKILSNSAEMFPTLNGLRSIAGSPFSSQLGSANASETTSPPSSPRAA